MYSNYDYLVVGAGLSGAVLAQQLAEHGNKRVLVVDRRSYVAGTAYTEQVGAIHVHKHGAHIFRTDDKAIWEYVNSFGEFRPYVHSPMARYRAEMYNLPFNMNTFHQLWGVNTPDEAKLMIGLTRVKCDNPQNLEEFALSEVGEIIYEKFIKWYTEKQWGVSCTELPPDTMKRIPIRFTYDNNYYKNKPYQGIPKDGYTAIVSNMLNDVRISVELQADSIDVDSVPHTIPVLFTGRIDEFYHNKFGALGYRTLRFEEERKETSNYQGCSVVNYTDKSTPFTRIIEHKHFTDAESTYTIITREYPAEFTEGSEAYYPMLDETNRNLYRKYLEYAHMHDPNVIFCGKLGNYQYMDMEDVVKCATQLAKLLLTIL